MERAYAGMPRTPADWASRARFEMELRELDMKSSPGWPYMRTNPTIGGWLGWDGISEFDRGRVEMLWIDVQNVLHGDYEHWFRVFVKDEPHKRKKINERKWRLIIASSLPVQMVWRLCFRHQNDWLNERPYEVPSAHGLVFPHGGWRRFKAMVRTQRLEWSRDISAWDVNMPGWVARANLALRLRWGGPADWKECVERLYDDAFHSSRLLFSKGFVLRQTYWGFMKSGLYNTIADNSLGMVVMHVVASFRSGLPVGKIKATGDDVLQSEMSDEYIRQLERLGCKVKEVERSADFMGTDFSEAPVPKYFAKHIVNVCYQSDENMESVLDSYLRLYVYSPLYPLWEELAQELGVRVYSRAFYLFWYDNPASKLLLTPLAK